MKAWLKRVLTCLLAVLLSLPPFGLLGMLPSAHAEPIILDSSASDWAAAELQLAYNYGLTYPDILTDFARPITREEFCVIVLLLYQKLTGQAVEATSSPFSDTSNPEIIKAYQLGIVKGTGEGKFSPALSITRQEIATMIFRALQKAFPSLISSTERSLPFSDQDQIADWALEAVKFVNQYGIMKGIGGNRIDPLSNTTREQGIVLIKRTYESFRSSEQVKATVRLQDPPLLLAEDDKFLALDFNNRLIQPAFDSRLELFAATGADKPSSMQMLSLDLVLERTLPLDHLIPASASSVYSRADGAALVEASGEKKRWFSFTLLDPQAATVVWQVSGAPFLGFSDNWKNPPGLLASGDVDPAAGEFAIDFATFTGAQRLAVRTSQYPLGTANTYQETAKTQRTYYVRAVPVDSSGQCLGDPGQGLRVLYGNPLVIPSFLSGSQRRTATPFQLWTPRRPGEPNHSSEFPNILEHLQEFGYDCNSTQPQWFFFTGFDAATTEVVMQVSEQPFSNENAEWSSPPGLLYSQSYSPLPVSLSSYDTNVVPVPLQDFLPDPAVLKTGDFIHYYVRSVALQPSSVPGCQVPQFSETIIVEYFKQQSIQLYTWKNEQLPSYIPQVKILDYQPIKWEDPNWTHFYQVFRWPNWNELNFKLTNLNTGGTLEPYGYTYIAQGITPQQYETDYLRKWLGPGSTIQVWDKEEDKSWWGELWDGIASFFSSLLEIVKNVTNWVAQAYSALKGGLISFVASNFPGIPDEWREGLKMALTALVDTGLASMGIPPELPNFKQLAEGGIDYLAKAALTEAGIPANAITDELVAQAADGISSGLDNASNSSSPNALNAPFLQSHPDYLYQPAFLDVEISNPYDQPSLPGALNVDVGWEWKENVTLQTWAWAQKPPDQQFAESITYAGHFLYGLSRGHNGYPIYYNIYEPVRALTIPILQPGETTTVRVYLKEYYGKPYPFAQSGDAVLWDDFGNLYWGTNGPSLFRVYTDPYNLPDPKEAAKAAGKPVGLDSGTNNIYTYQYDKIYSGGTFEQIPSLAYP